jgi:hypothetical protein
MKSLTAAVVAALIAASGLSLVNPAAADAAARKKHHDTPGCMDRKEYRAIHSGMTPARVAQIADIRGAQIYNYDDGYYEGAWVNDGYWEDFGYWDSEYDPVTDTYTDVYVPDEEWIDTSYYDATANWVSMTDTVRSYKKCKSFQRGRGRVGINFDNYSHGSGLHVFMKVNSNPYRLVDVVESATIYARSGTGKSRPSAPTTRPAKPHFRPLTPKPQHPEPRVPEPATHS